ncbi:MAG TPA: DUF1194 domain-containing protein [Geminicoccaceae bacterium]|nr:DUF1194 domain-containing protein [Geminicoccus sp.]HMU51146.1 DUF1194 domain-containing protein [Geminicoccaceae bacterium]
MRACSALALAMLAWPAAGRSEEMPVDLELVLAVDVSGSVDGWEAQQQREGYVAAIADPAVVRAIGSNFHGRIAVTYVEWSGSEQQHVLMPWRVIGGAEDAATFASELAEQPVTRMMYTSISQAIDFSVPLFEQNGYAGDRRVIDVSGDGPNNRGRPLEEARAAALALGITINGLPILNDRPQPWAGPTPREMNLDRYYAEQVIGGPGSFTVVAEDFTAFKEAILTKLILEIADRGEGTVRIVAR